MSRKLVVPALLLLPAVAVAPVTATGFEVPAGFTSTP